MSPTFQPNDLLPETDEDLPRQYTPPTGGLPTNSPIVEVGEDVNRAEAEDEQTSEDETTVTYRGATSDPIFGYAVSLALAIGLSPLVARGLVDLRYTLVWGLMAGFGVLAWTLGSSARVGQENPGDLAWGVVFGLIVSTPLYVFGGATLSTTADLVFQGMTIGTVLAYLLFVMPLAETTFFRGILQQGRSFWVIGILSTVWSIILFFPALQVFEYPVVAFVIGTVLLIVNIIYSYVRQRNGLAAAWLCQITINVVLLFLPLLS